MSISSSYQYTWAIFNSSVNICQECVLTCLIFAQANWKQFVLDKCLINAEGQFLYQNLIVVTKTTPRDLHEHWWTFEAPINKNIHFEILPETFFMSMCLIVWFVPPGWSYWTLGLKKSGEDSFKWENSNVFLNNKYHITYVCKRF